MADEAKTTLADEVEAALRRAAAAVEQFRRAATVTREDWERPCDAGARIAWEAHNGRQ